MDISFKTLNKIDYPYIDNDSIGKIYGILYGKNASIRLTCVNTNQDSENQKVNAVYKLPEQTTDIGVAYIEVDDVWKKANIVTVDYEKGILTISNGRASNGNTYTLKLVDCYGYVTSGHSYPRQILEHFFKIYGGIEYIDSNFNKTLWESELDHVDIQADIGFYINDSDKTFLDIIYEISRKSKRYFRVDYTSDGKIYAKRIDLKRASSRVIPSSDIHNADTISISSSRDGVYSSILTKYYKNDYDDTWLSIRNTTYENEVARNYRKVEEFEEETFLVNNSDATERAYKHATIFSDIQYTAELELFENYDIDLYDVITVSLMPDNLSASSRRFVGNKDCLVIATNPKEAEQINYVTVQIIPDRTPIASQSAILSSGYTTVEKAKSTIEIVEDIASAATVTYLSLLAAQATGKVGDLFTEGGITYRANYSRTAITLANSTRITTIRFNDVADINALNALTGMINYDSVYQLDTLQWYYYLNGWQTDGAPPLNGQYTNTIFAVNNSPAAYPALSQVDAPPGWYDAPPVVGDSEYLWMSKSTWRDSTRLSNWSTPVRISGTLTTLTTQYSIDGINWTTSTTGAIYMRTSPDGGTTWSDAIRVKGEQGAQGPSGSGLYVQISDPTETSASYQDGQLGTFAGYNYIWTATSSSTGYWTIQERNPISSDSLYAYYSFDENGTTVFGDYLCIDNSGKTHNGYAKNATIVTGFRGNALSITARNQYINI